MVGGYLRKLPSLIALKPQVLLNCKLITLNLAFYTITSILFYISIYITTDLLSLSDPAPSIVLFLFAILALRPSPIRPSIPLADNTRGLLELGLL